VTDRGFAVPWEVVDDIRVAPVPGALRPTVRLTGSLMESARVFAGVDVTPSAEDHEITVTVRSRLIDDPPTGGPDFDEVVEVDVPAGRYRVVYRTGDNVRRLGSIEL
jgi:hypothetical protein